MFRLKILVLMACCLMAAGVCRAQQGVAQADSLRNSNDSIRISLLTCDAGGEVYSLFGHSAIRYEVPSKGIDVVFNYGVFSFDAPNFALRFALGQTDYMLAAEPYAYFDAEYSYSKRDVWQQTLNLTLDEKLRLASLLEENMRPENRTYRYSFFYDNCATRPRDKVEQAVGSAISYGRLLKEGETMTFRDIIHQYTEGHPWSRFGIDFCLGSKADKPISEREMMFAPFYLEKAFSGATLADGRSLVSQRVKKQNGSAMARQTDVWDVLTPLRTSLLLFIVVASATIYGIRHRRSLWWIDIVLFAAAGLAGCVVAFLCILSEHPAVSPNYLLFVFHPLHLLLLPAVVYAEIKHKTSPYHVLNIVVLTLFIVLYSVIPQRFDFAVVPLALCLLIRSLSNLTLTHKKSE